MPARRDGAERLGHERETELYKDKIEVSLDGRQIFYLFFGGAVIVGLVFVLGVMVGRRVEARGHVDRAHTEASTDPLAALDRLEGSGGAALTVQQAAARAGAGDAGGRAGGAEDRGEEGGEEGRAQGRQEGRRRQEGRGQEGRGQEDDEAKKDDAKKDDAKKDAKKDDEPKARYTLQLSSFQDRGEAQSFADDLKTTGFEASITEASVDGKTYFRVRLGNYRSLEAANDAKAQLEKNAKKSAQVMRL